MPYPVFQKNKFKISTFTFKTKSITSLHFLFSAFSFFSILLFITSILFLSNSPLKFVNNCLANTRTNQEVSEEALKEQLAEEKKATEQALAAYHASLLEIKILETENHTLFTVIPEQFIKISHHAFFYQEVEKQLPANAYLLDVFIPSQYEQDLNRDFYGNITRMIYVYTMPYILHESPRIQKYQLGFIKKSLLSVLNFFEPLASLKSEVSDVKFTWETKVYERLMRGQSIHFRYPTHTAKNGEDEILSMLQTYPLDTVRNIGTKSSEAVDGTGYRYTGAFMSTYIFERNRQAYFISASSFITDNNYYDELMWTRNTIEDFVRNIAPRPIVNK